MSLRLLSPLCLTRRLLLIRYRAAARSLAGPGVGMRPLAAHRQAAAVPQAAVGTHLDVTLDVHRDFLAKVAFHGAFLFQNLADLVDFVFGQVPDLLIEIDAGPVEQRAGACAPHAVNVSQPDLGPLGCRQIDACDTRHMVVSASAYITGWSRRAAPRLRDGSPCICRKYSFPKIELPK